MGCRVALGDVCSFYRGASVPRTRMYDKGAYLYIHYGDLYKGFDLHIDVEDPAKPIPYILNNEKIKDSQRLRDQDIVYVLTSETVDDLGHAYLFNNPKEKPTISGTETTIVRVNRRDLVVPAYLNYLMSSPRFIRELRQYTRGMKVFRVHPKDVARIEIDLPQTEVQHQIVSILDAIYAKQQANSKLNGYLVKACDVLYSNYTAGEQAAGWPMGTLEDLLEIRYGKDHKKLNDGNIPVYGSGGYMRSVDRFLYSGESVLIPRKGSLNNVMYVSKKFWTVDTMFYAVPKSPNVAKYAYQFIKRLDLASMNSGSAVPSMTTKILNALPVPIPPKESLHAFDDQLQPYYSAICANAIENELLAALRDALLPKLMSGEIDVSKVDLKQLNSHLA
ncbi:MAG: restriction endonuclease subunit S [Collinsella sp.]|nr:restriction endonuclease subunit S [Collinsella sp.]